MHPHRLHQHRPAVLVVSRVVNVLSVQRVIHPAPRVDSVVTLQNVLARIVQLPIAQDEAQPTQLQILLVVALDGVGHKSQPNLVVSPPPTPAGKVAAKLERLIALGIRKRLMLTLIPAKPPKYAQVVRQLLLGVQSKAILHRAILLHRK